MTTPFEKDRIAAEATEESKRIIVACVEDTLRALARERTAQLGVDPSNTERLVFLDGLVARASDLRYEVVAGL